MLNLIQEEPLTLLTVQLQSGQCQPTVHGRQAAAQSTLKVAWFDISATSVYFCADLSSLSLCLTLQLNTILPLPPLNIIVPFTTNGDVLLADDSGVDRTTFVVGGGGDVGSSWALLINSFLLHHQGPVKIVAKISISKCAFNSWFMAISTSVVQAYRQGREQIMNTRMQKQNNKRHGTNTTVPEITRFVVSFTNHSPPPTHCSNARFREIYQAAANPASPSPPNTQHHQHKAR